MDKERIERAVREILEAVGEDPSRKGCWKLRPGGRMYEEIFSGLESDPLEH